MGIRNIGFLTNRDQTVREVIEGFGEIPNGTSIVISGKTYPSDEYVIYVNEDTDVFSDIPDALLELDVLNFSASRDCRHWVIVLHVNCGLDYDSLLKED